MSYAVILASVVLVRRPLGSVDVGMVLHGRYDRAVEAGFCATVRVRIRVVVGHLFAADAWSRVQTLCSARFVAHHSVQHGCPGACGHSKCGSFLGKMLCSLHRIGPWRTLPRGSTAMAPASHFFTSLLRCSRLGFASRWEWPPSGQASDGTASIAQSSVARPHLSRGLGGVLVRVHKGTAQRQVLFGVCKKGCLWRFVAGGPWTLQAFEAAEYDVNRRCSICALSSTQGFHCVWECQTDSVAAARATAACTALRTVAIDAFPGSLSSARLAFPGVLKFLFLRSVHCD